MYLWSAVGWVGNSVNVSYVFLHVFKVFKITD